VLRSAEVVPIREWIADRRLNTAGKGDEDPGLLAPVSADAPPPGNLLEALPFGLSIRSATSMNLAPRARSEVFSTRKRAPFWVRGSPVLGRVLDAQHDTQGQEVESHAGHEDGFGERTGRRLLGHTGAPAIA
jgi:hypothetical protein